MKELSDLLSEAKELEVEGKYSEAENKLTTLAKEATNNRDPLASDVYNALGIVKRMLKKPDEALLNYKAAIAVSQNNKQRAEAHINIADIERVFNNNSKAAHSSLEVALRLAEHASLIAAKAADQKGLVYIAESKFDKATESYIHAKDICEKLIETMPKNKDVKNRYAQVIHHLGVAYNLSGDASNAYDAQIKALEIFTELNDKMGIVNTVSSLGTIELEKGDIEKAISIYDKARIILEKTKYERGITSLSLKLAEANLTKKDNERFDIYFERFRQGVVEGHLTEHDLGLMKETYEKIRLSCESKGFIKETFKELNPFFG